MAFFIGYTGTESRHTMQLSGIPERKTLPEKRCPVRCWPIDCTGKMNRTKTTTGYTKNTLTEKIPANILLLSWKARNLKRNSPKTRFRSSESSCPKPDWFPSFSCFISFIHQTENPSASLKQKCQIIRSGIRSFRSSSSVYQIPRVFWTMAPIAPKTINAPQNKTPKASIISLLAKLVKLVLHVSASSAQERNLPC